MVVVLKAFVERCVSLVLGHPFEFSWLDVSQADVFHRSSPFGGSQQHNLARWIVHPIVAAHRKNRQQRRTILISENWRRETGDGNRVCFFRVRTSIRFDPHQVADWLEMKMPSHSVRTQRHSESIARA
jgi:hypothetical protein